MSQMEVSQTDVSPAQYYVPQSTAWSFTQGLICGQASVVVVLLVFIKFFVFSEAPSSANGKLKKKDVSGVIVKREKNDDAESGATADSTKLATILEKTYYDVHNHNPESLDWFNVLIAQTISQFRSEALLADNIYHSLSNFLETLELPDFMDKIKLTEIDIGDDFPIFSNCRIQHSADGSGRLEAKIDVDLSDTLTLGIETRLLLNHPRPLTAVLPIQLTVSMVRFSGCLTVSLINTNDTDFVETGKEESPSTGGTALMFSFSPDYRLEFSVKSLIGSRTKLQDVPKISDLIDSKLRSWFADRCIEPKFQVVRLPSMWPRSKNTREPVGKPE